MCVAYLWFIHSFISFILNSDYYESQFHALKREFLLYYLFELFSFLNYQTDVCIYIISHERCYSKSSEKYTKKVVLKSFQSSRRKMRSIIILLFVFTLIFICKSLPMADEQGYIHEIPEFFLNELFSNKFNLIAEEAHNRHKRMICDRFMNEQYCDIVCRVRENKRGFCTGGQCYCRKYWSWNTKTIPFLNKKYDFTAKHFQ